MEYRRIGRSGILGSKIVLGTLNFGTKVSEEDSFAIMDKALEAGINVFDTANGYGNGASEKTIGKWLLMHPENRDKIYLNSKMYCSINDGKYGVNDRDGLSYLKMVTQIDDSLKRLHTDYLDMLTIHFQPEYDFYTELFDGYENLRNRGLVHYLGASNFSSYAVCRCQEEARKRNIQGLVLSQNRYNLCSREIEIELIPALKNENISLWCWGPLFSGRLTSKFFTNRDMFTNQPSEELINQLTEFKAGCEKFGLKEENVAISWLLKKDCFVISGPSTIEELESYLSSENTVIPDELNELITDLFPGYPEAPMAYLAMNKQGTWKMKK